MSFFGGEIYLVLRDASGPQKADDFSVFFFGEASKNTRCILPEVARSALHFPLLIERARVDFDFRADGAFIVGERFKVDAHPVVLIPAFVAKNDGRASELSNNEIGVAVAGEIGDG